MFNAISTLLTGGETVAKEIRIITAIELARNAKFYAYHPYLESAWKSEGNPFHSKTTMFATILSDESLSVYKSSTDNKEECIRKEAMLCLMSGKYSPFINLMAASSALGVVLESIYTLENSDPRIAFLFNGRLTPRKSLESHTKSLKIMWSSTLFSSMFQPNHFLPLVKPSSINAPTVDKNTIGSDNNILTVMCGKKDAGNSSSKNPFKRKCDQAPAEAAKKEKKGTVVPEFVDRNDIGLHYQNVLGMSNDAKYDLLCNAWKPAQDYIFPTKVEAGRVRRFRYEWLQSFQWLTYSKAADGAFCLYCVLFGHQLDKKGIAMINLFLEPHKRLTSAFSFFKKHESGSCKIHNNAVAAALQFKKVMENQILPVNRMAQPVIDNTIKENRMKLRSVIDTIVLCGKQNLAYRGRRDDSSNYAGIWFAGNFQALLAYRAEGGDALLKEHIKSSSGNATYRSKTIQNELISLCGDFVLDSILTQVKAAKIFAVMADEVKDSSCLEQLPIAVRFVDKDNMIKEKFIGYVRLPEGTSGKQIANSILNIIREMGLDMNNCLGQTYDGAANMSGKCLGAATLIKNDFSKAEYIHCSSHQLNLCVAKSCSIVPVHNMMNTVKAVNTFFDDSPKRMQFFRRQLTVLCPEITYTRLKDVCRTRWVERIDGLDRFEDIYCHILSVLISIQNNEIEQTNEVQDGICEWNQQSRNEASSLLKAIMSFDFVICLVVTRRMFAYTKQATVLLQGEEMDIVKAYEMISILDETIKDVRTHVNEYHGQWFATAKELIEKVGGKVERPRVCATQRNRQNYAVASPEEYYRCAVTIPMLDHMLVEINNRFSFRQMQAVKGFGIIPSIICRSKLIERKKRLSDIVDFVSTFQSDLLDIVTVEAQLDLWRKYWEKADREKLPKCISTTLRQIDSKVFPAIHSMLRVLGTLPMTSCTVERSASTLRRIKTWLRSTMAQKRLNSLALMHVHKDVTIDTEAIIDRFARKHPRRMQFKSMQLPEDCTGGKNIESHQALD